MASSQSPMDTTNMATSTGLHHMRNVLCYLVPATVLTYYILASTISTCTLQNLKAHAGKTPFKVLLWLMILVLMSFVVEALMLVVDTIDNGARYSSTASNVYALSNVLVWIILVGGLDSENPVWYPHCGAWLMTLIAEATFLILGLSYGPTTTAFVYTQIAIQASRILILALLPTITFTRFAFQNVTDPESSPLLDQSKTSPITGQDPKDSPPYGSISKPSDSTDNEDEDDYLIKKDQKKKKVQERLLANGNWVNYARSFSMFVPLLLPTKDRILLLNFFGVFVCLACGRALNVLQPRQFGIVLDRMSTVTSDGHLGSIMSEIALFVFYRWIEGVLIGPVNKLFWQPIEQNADRSLQTAAYNHIMDLSRNFHTEKQSGELYTSISQGSSIINILKTVIFRMLPVFADLALAAIYLYYVFGPYMALTLASTSVIYLWSSTWFLSKQTEIHRTSTKLARKQAQIMYDSVGNWDTVSHFNTARYEKGRYSHAVGSYLTARLQEIYLLYMAWSGENFILELGLIGAAFLAVHRIAHGSVPVGGFAMLIYYWSNFSGRLDQLIGTRREFLAELVDAEALRELFEKSPTVEDGSVALEFKRGSVEFRGVSFAYDGEKNSISDFNLRVESGQRVALVGETGGGKSTVLKLLFRFYDPQKGCIMIDEQDTKSVTLQSLRNCIGIVPQDPSLFNTTIMENVRYSKLDATDDQVKEACKAAAIHDKILQFPRGYLSKVGEKGVKLSGGELQRIAIARVILKEPKIVLLDEATSAVDTETESHIQEALRKLTLGRTTFTVAHRLSTVSDADNILVIKEGAILEQGPPHILLKAKGKYFDLWTKQVGITAIAPDEPSKSSKPSDHLASCQTQDESRSMEASATSMSRSLRATAPEFLPRNEATPHGQQETVVEDGQSPRSQGIPGHQQADQMDESKNQIEAQKKGGNPFFQRRLNNKSEPSRPVDGPSDRPSTTHGQPRRAPAPSDPPPVRTRARDGTHGRRHRQRRWRRRDDKSALTKAGPSSGGPSA